MSNPFIKFQIRYLKSYLKHMAFIGRENKTIFNVKSRLCREWNAIYASTVHAAPFNKEQRDKALLMMSCIETQINSLYKPFDLDGRFVWKGSLYEKFPHYVHYVKDGNPRTKHFSNDEMITAAHILYNKLRGKKHHLKDGEKEHEYIHTLTYWTERLAFLYEEECARQLIPRDFLATGNCSGESGDGEVRSDAHCEGAGSHG